MLRRSTISVWIVGLGLLAQHAAISDERPTCANGKSLAQAAELIELQIENNSYMTTRGLITTLQTPGYDELAGNQFVARLQALGENDLVIDQGAGSGVLAQHFYQNPAQFPHPARMIGVTVTEPSRGPLEWIRWKKFLRKNRHRYRYLSGRKIEKYSVSELGRAKLIVDIKGALSYTADIPAVIAKDAELLLQGGELRSSRLAEIFVIKDENDHEIPYLEWLAQMKGFKLRLESQIKGRELKPKSNVYAIVMERTNEAFELPPGSFRLIDLMPGGKSKMPVRTYRWIRP